MVFVWITIALLVIVAGVDGLIRYPGFLVENAIGQIACGLFILGWIGFRH